jgi:hypothetical protein
MEKFIRSAAEASFPFIFFLLFFFFSFPFFSFPFFSFLFLSFPFPFVSFRFFSVADLCKSFPMPGLSWVSSPVGGGSGYLDSLADNRLPPSLLLTWGIFLFLF